MALSPKFLAEFDAFKKAVDEAEEKLKRFDQNAKRVEKALVKLANSFSGRA